MFSLCNSCTPIIDVGSSVKRRGQSCTVGTNATHALSIPLSSWLYFIHIPVIFPLLVSTGPIRPRSPGKADAVYIICVVNDDGDLEYSGTAFAVNPTMVVTCFHNIYDEEKDGVPPKIFSTCFLVPSLQKYAKESAVVYPPRQSWVEVHLVGYSEGDDWAVLQRMDEVSFGQWLTVCPEVALPTASVSVFLTVYFAPLAYIDDEVLRELKIWHESTEIMQYECDATYMVVSNGKCRGASGAPIVTLDGTVIAYHTESFNEQRFAEVSSAVKPVKSHQAKRRRLTAKALATTHSNEPTIAGLQSLMDHRFADYTERLSSTKSHTDFSRATVLCKLPDLMEIINEL